MTCPEYGLGERIADGIIHVLGVGGSLIAVAILIAIAVSTLPLGVTASLAVYGLAMIAMFGFSAAYHLVPLPDWKLFLRKLDQAAIFIKIAGTYTPFALVKMGGFAGYTLFSVVWAVALSGAAAKLFIEPKRDWFSVPLYLALGWAGLAAIQPLVMSVPTESLILLGVGGAIYTVGVLFHIWDSLPYQNAIWHLFVLAGTACHFAAVTLAVFD
ncbi:PAQR family membrane homeostasis protein TrhA [Dichotomicrobium thermohalophilum]|uniref:Hemolysin III n=1 Tax=Dichotomicrobium thermohalophilum TaxID=933063 RepID=A0A397Q5D0_9HYPH|nr:hemolysin III family protein [Dichotomicrobium thermohalophilum]RIA56312.1 hemolysin III [Dichotomicrobium thermohalophilum]